MKKAITNIIVIFLVLIIPLILYLSNFRLMLFNMDFYEQEFEKHGVYERVGKEVADNTNSELLAYFRDGKRDNLVDTDLFDVDEKRHLLDVKNVVQKTSSLFIILVSFAVISLVTLYFLDSKNLMGRTALIFILGGALTIIITSVILLLAKINFDAPFTFLHQMLFEEGTWQFSEGSNLIGMYPAGFFYDTLRKIFFNATIHGFVAAFIASFYPDKRKLFKHQ